MLQPNDAVSSGDAARRRPERPRRRRLGPARGRAAARRSRGRVRRRIERDFEGVELISWIHGEGDELEARRPQRLRRAALPRRGRRRRSRGGTWSVEGDLGALGASIERRPLRLAPDYPDALAAALVGAPQSRTPPTSCSASLPAGSASTGAGPPTSPAAATARCARTTRSGTLLTVGLDGERPEREQWAISDVAELVDGHFGLGERSAAPPRRSMTSAPRPRIGRWSAAKKRRDRAGTRPRPLGAGGGRDLGDRPADPPRHPAARQLAAALPVRGRRRHRLRGQPGRLHAAQRRRRRPPPARGGRRLRRRGDQQLRPQPALDVPQAGLGRGAGGLPGRALLRRSASSASRSTWSSSPRSSTAPGWPSCRRRRSRSRSRRRSTSSATSSGRSTAEATPAGCDHALSQRKQRDVEMVNFKKLADRAKAAKRVVDEQGGTEAPQGQGGEAPRHRPGRRLDERPGAGGAPRWRARSRTPPTRSRATTRAARSAAARPHRNAERLAARRAVVAGGPERAGGDDRRRPLARRGGPGPRGRRRDRGDRRAPGGLTEVSSGLPETPDDYDVSARQALRAADARSEDRRPQGRGRSATRTTS